MTARLIAVLFFPRRQGRCWRVGQADGSAPAWGPLVQPSSPTGPLRSPSHLSPWRGQSGEPRGCCRGSSKLKVGASLSVGGAGVAGLQIQLNPVYGARTQAAGLSLEYTPSLTLSSWKVGALRSRLRQQKLPGNPRGATGPAQGRRRASPARSKRRALPFPWAGPAR